MSKFMYSLDDKNIVEIGSYFESSGEKYALCYLGRSKYEGLLIGARKISRLIEIEE